MQEKLANICDEIQKKIYQETTVEFGEEFVKRWTNPNFVGRLETYTHMAKVKPSCGSVLEIYIVLEEDKIKEISFYTDGCGSDFVCAEVACELALGKTKDQALTLESKHILQVIPKLPLDKHGALYPPLKALQEALQKP